MNIYLILHALLAAYSLSGVCSKLAATSTFLSLRFCLCYGGMIFLLGLYAVVWQQIIKKIPLSSAYANKSATVIWGVIWGALFFGEGFSWLKILGALFVIAGIVYFSLSDSKIEKSKKAKKKGACEDE